MFDSFIEPRAAPHLTEPGDAGKTDWVMRNPGTSLSIIYPILTCSLILQYIRNSHARHNRFLRLLPLARTRATFRTMHQETSQTYDISPK